MKLFLARAWLIRKLAGKNTVILNVRFDGAAAIGYTEFPIIDDGLTLEFVAKNDV